MRMQQLPHLKTQKSRPIGRLMQFSSPRFREVHRTLTGEEEPVNPRSRATKGVGTQGCQHSYFFSCPLPHREAAPHLARPSGRRGKR